MITDCHFGCLRVVVCWLVTGCFATAAIGERASVAERQLDWAIAVHCGAGAGPSEFTAHENLARRAALAKALRIGSQVLTTGGASLDAVEQVIRVMEDEPLFNAGKGAVLTAAGMHELDASIMNGRDLSCGGVASVTRVKNPISLARAVMEKTPHVLLVGAGAEQLATELDYQLVKNEYFRTARQFGAWQASQAAAAPERGTVGCVALDREGNLAAGTSTGGLMNKRWGRVGDSPLIGAGTYADNATCAVSCTGIGEHFIRYAVAYDVSALMKYKQQSLGDAVRLVVHDKLQKNWGGLIAVDRDGVISIEHNTAAMGAAAADSSGRLDVYWTVDVPLSETAPAGQ